MIVIGIDPGRINKPGTGLAAIDVAPRKPGVLRVWDLTADPRRLHHDICSCGPRLIFMESIISQGRRLKQGPMYETCRTEGAIQAIASIAYIPFFTIGRREVCRLLGGYNDAEIRHILNCIFRRKFKQGHGLQALAVAYAGWSRWRLRR